MTTAYNTDGWGNKLVTVFAGSQSSTGTIVNLAPGRAPLHVI